MPKEFEPDDPLELVGVKLQDGDPDQAFDAIVQEYLFMGWTALQIMFLFRSPHYGATHQMYRRKGEAQVKERIQQLADQWRQGWIGGGDSDA